MSIVSFNFFVFITLFLIIYYVIPSKYQWYCLLIMSILFYLINTQENTVWLMFTIIGTYLFTNVIEDLKEKNATNAQIRLLFIINIIIALSPLLLLKYIISSVYTSIALPMGISFYTLQLIGYSVDVYKGKFKAEHNLLKYMLFAMFFPQIIQGPIARYDKLSESLYKPHNFEEDKITKGFMLVLWGLFLKLVLADHAAVIVDTVFNDYKIYTGFYILIAGVLYSIQLYADFMGCVCIAKGISSMFGIELMDNFNHPYFANSIKDFWRRWHISLSSWLRDYIYIPLGGNRKGAVPKYINLIITFIVSGLWHGVGLQFIFWGVLHGMYQIIGDLTQNIRTKCKTILHIKGTFIDSACQRIFTFVLVMLAWIFFRAASFQQGIEMVVLMIKDFNIKNWKGGALFQLGLSQKDCIVLAICILLLILVSLLQEKICIREKILRFSIIIRYMIYVLVICAILVFGIYGSGYDAGAFIYGGF